MLCRMRSPACLEGTMSDENQIAIPRPFIDLFIPKGSIKPSEPRAVIAERYELCEDLAQMLIEGPAQIGQPLIVLGLQSDGFGFDGGRLG